MEADDLEPAEVERPPVGLLVEGRSDERIDRIVDVREIAQLSTLPDLERVALHHGPDPDTEECLPCVADAHVRSVGVRQAQGARADPIHVVVEDVVSLAGCLVDPVHIHGKDRVVFVHRQVRRPAVDLAGAREHDLDLGVVPAARFEDRELRATVDLEIRLRIGHRIEMARLAREVEQNVLALQEIPEAVLVADVGDVDPDLIRDLRHVAEVPPVLRDQAVNQRHVRAFANEAAGEVRADEPQAAGDQDSPPLEAAHAVLAVCGAANRNPR